jgi:hypothetical protein
MSVRNTAKQLCRVVPLGTIREQAVATRFMQESFLATAPRRVAKSSAGCEDVKIPGRRAGFDAVWRKGNETEAPSTERQFTDGKPADHVAAHIGNRPVSPGESTISRFVGRTCVSEGSAFLAKTGRIKK